MEMKKMKPMFGALACLFFILLLLVCMVIDTTTSSSSSSNSIQGVKMMQRSENLLGSSSKEKRQVHRQHRLDTDLFRGSKRRVPNGPDPIHNRRAGKSGRPPGRA